MNILRYVLAALIALFAFLQLNDPDPIVWVVAYGVVAVAIAIPPRYPVGRKLAWLGGGMLLILALESFQGVIAYFQSGAPGSLFAEMSPSRPWVEPAREFLGVMIAGAVLVGVRRKRHV